MAKAYICTVHCGDRQEVDTPSDYNTVLDRDKVEVDLPIYEEAVGGLVMSSGVVGNFNDLNTFQTYEYE